MQGPEPKDKSKNFMFSKSDCIRLDEIRAKTGVAGSVIVRNALAYYWTMIVFGHPICANGSQCLCPQLYANTTMTAQSPGAMLMDPTNIPDPPLPHPELPVQTANPGSTRP